MTSPAGRLLTLEQYRHQLAVRAQVVRDAHRLWATFRLGDRGSWERMVALAIPILAVRHALSSHVAARYYQQMAVVETGTREAAVLASALPAERVSASLIATGLVGATLAASRGASAEAASLAGFVRFQGGMGRLALDGGRQTLMDSMRASSRSPRWERITGETPCEFCQMLADRGAVYSEDTVDFQSHDNCVCTAEPEFA